MIIAVDTGGTKTLITSFDQHGTPIELAKFPTPKDTKEYLNELSAIITPYTNGQLKTLVVALPGVINDGVAVLCPNLGWKNFAIVKELETRFKGVTILVENDANLGGLGEVRLLATTPHSALYITVSTGIGTGIIVDGHIDPAVRLSEGGHMLIEYKGKLKQWEKVASGRAIVRVYKKFARDLLLKRAWRQIANNISRGLFAILPIIQPDVVIIGGSVGTHFEKYDKRLKEIIKDFLPPIVKQPRIVKAKYPEYAVIYGCYFYAIDHSDARR